MALTSSSALLYVPNNWASEETRELHALVCTVWPQYLTLRETVDIIDRFTGPQWKPNQQVLWTGLGTQQLYALVDAYARENAMQTLRSAMGPLMDPQHPNCLKNQKTSKEWGRYINGASLIFAWRIAQEDVTTVLTRPPPIRYNPSGRSAYQEIELPVLKGLLGFQAVSQIMAAHPTVAQAGTFPPYEIWPDDKKRSWIAAFGTPKALKNKWRKVYEGIPLPSWAVTATAYGLVAVDEESRHVNTSSFFSLMRAAVSGNLISAIVMLLRRIAYRALSKADSLESPKPVSSAEGREAEELRLALPLSNITIAIEDKKVTELCKGGELDSISRGASKSSSQWTVFDGAQTDFPQTNTLPKQQVSNTNSKPARNSVSQGTQTDESVLHSLLEQYGLGMGFKAAKKKIKKAASTQKLASVPETQLNASTCSPSLLEVNSSNKQQKAKKICSNVMKKAKFSVESPAESSTQALQPTHQMESKDAHKQASKTKKATKTQKKSVNDVKGKDTMKQPVVKSRQPPKVSDDAPKLKGGSEEKKAKKATTKKSNKKKEKSENVKGKGKEKETLGTAGGASSKSPSTKGKEPANSGGSGKQGGSSRPRTSAK